MKKKKINEMAILRTRLKSEYTDKLSPIINILNGMGRKASSIECTVNNTLKFDDLYNLLSKKELLIQAFGNLEKNKGRLTKGITNLTIDGMNIKRIENLATKIKEKTFKFTPVRRVYVKKPKLLKKGEKPKMRPLGIPTFEDRIVQEAIRILLNVIYEPTFEKNNLNYGFRENKSTHHAILKTKYNGTGLNMAIEGDIKGAYDNVDHDILLKILSYRILDKDFLKLIHQGFKCGLLDQGQYEDTITGVPQGGIASPILFNIYMHEFDMYIKHNLNSFLEEINNNSNRTYKPRNKKYSIINTQYARAKVKYYKYKDTLENKKFVELNIEEQSTLLKLRESMREKDKLKALTPSIMKDQKLIKVSYVRYADDFLILTNANRKMTKIIKTKLEEFLQSKLKLELSKDKTLITNLKTTPAKFLGFSIKTYPKRSFSITKELAYTKKVDGTSLLM